MLTCAKDEFANVSAQVLHLLALLYKSTNTDAGLRMSSQTSAPRYSICLLYWYKSTNTDVSAQFAALREELSEERMLTYADVRWAYADVC